MNIGIDIDGVLTNYEREQLDYGTKICIDEGWPIDIDINKYHETEVFNWNREQATKFWNKYLIKYFKETLVRTFAPEVIEKLREDLVKRILKYKLQCGVLKYVNNDDSSFSIEFNNPFENLNTREAIFNSARRKNIDLYIDYFTIPSKVKL